MNFKLTVLQAGHGDSILIQGKFGGHPRNILIDGGAAKTYQFGVFPGPLKKKLLEIKENGQRIDLLVLTHVDDDHINGLLSGFDNNELLAQLTDKIWFNSGKLIFKHFNKTPDASNSVYLEGNNTAIGEERKTSIGQGVEFESLISEKGIWHEELILAGQKLNEFGIKFTILSPTEKKLKKLLTVWKRKSPESLTASGKGDYSEKFDTILNNDKYTEDTSKSNGSSIAFIFEYKDKRILLLGDAHNSVIVESLKKLKYSSENPIKIDYVKLAHHGSKKNTSEELLNMIDCNNFIFSSNTDIHRLPNKTTIARLTKVKPQATLLFNYPDIIEDIIFKNDADNLSKLRKNGVILTGCEDSIEI